MSQPEEQPNFDVEHAAPLIRGVRLDRHPYQVGVMIALLVFSITYMIFGRVPTKTGLSQTEVVLLVIAFLVGSVIGLAGSAYPSTGDVRLGLQLGVIGQACVFFGFGYLAIHFLTVMQDIDMKNNLAAAFTVCVTAALAVASLWRVWQGMARLRIIHRYVEEHHE